MSKKVVKKIPKRESLNFELGVNTKSIGYKIDLLIRSDLKNWEGKEIFFNPETPIEIGNKAIYESFKANKIRNKMITELNAIVHGGPTFHFRNYHNY